jgi:hypothetical protein
MADVPDRPMRRTRLKDADLAAAWRKHSSGWCSLPFPDGAFDLVVAFMSLEVTFVSEHQPLEATRTRSRALGSASNG